MNILNKLTIKNLKLNKKRTIVTIIGIMLSTALICAVAGMVSSFMATLVENAKDEYGNRHITVENVSSDDLKYFENNRYVDTMYKVGILGYANLEGSENEYKPYLYILSYNKEALENSKVHLIDGRLPENSHEIVIPETVLTNASVNIQIGDRITLEIGNRVCSDGSALTQTNPYFVPDGETIDECHEYLANTYTGEFTVVGIMERVNTSIESFSAPGFTAITYNSENIQGYDVSLLFKNPSYYETFVENLENSNALRNYSYNLNNELLRWEGVTLSDSNQSMLYAIAGVVIGIIIVTSVFVIRNSFNISIMEKTKQYGMLASVGATSKQIKKNVLYEGFILGVIAIPLGILCGILACFILSLVINLLLGDFLNNIKFVFSVPLIPILLSIILASITIYLSVISAARRSSKISPIEAIRNNNEIKINPKKLKTPKIISKMFGIGGEIAHKNLKRARKKYRTTVISLVVSVAVFISLSSLLNYGFKLTGMYYSDYQYNFMVLVNTDNKDEVAGAYEEILSFEDVDKYALHRTTLLEVSARDYMSEEGFYQNFGEYLNRYDTPEEELIANISVISLGKEEYERFIKEIGGNVSGYKDKGILIDDVSTYQVDHYETINVYKDVTSFSGVINGSNVTIPIATRTEKRPMGLEGVYTDSGYIIVSDEFMDNLTYNYEGLYISSNDVENLEKTTNDYLKNTTFNSYVYNVDAEVQANRSMLILVAIFLYGFIIVISLIGITNIFNTITTNMNLRSKEFAMLKSIGMTKHEFNKMVRLESLFYGTKSLVIGIPLGIIGSILIYKAFEVGNDLGYVIPWESIIIASIVVFLLISIIMHFSVKKINKQNIIETIRNDNI